MGNGKYYTRNLVILAALLFIPAGMLSQEHAGIIKSEEKKITENGIKKRIEDLRTGIVVLKMEQGDVFAPQDLENAARALKEAETCAGREQSAEALVKITEAENFLARAKGITEKENVSGRIKSAGDLLVRSKEIHTGGTGRAEVGHAESVINEARALFNSGSYRDALHKVYEAEIVLSSVLAEKPEKKDGTQPDKKAITLKPKGKPVQKVPNTIPAQKKPPVKTAAAELPKGKIVFKNLQFGDFILGDKRQNVLKLIEKNEGSFKKEDAKNPELAVAFKQHSVTFCFYKDILYRMNVLFIVKNKDEYALCMEHLIQKYGRPGSSFGFGIGEKQVWESGGYAVIVNYFIGNYYNFLADKKWSPEIHIEYIDTAIEKKDVEKDIRLKFKDL